LTTSTANDVVVTSRVDTHQDLHVAALRRLGEQLGIAPETLRNWVIQAEIDEGHRPGTTTDDATRLAELEREVRELRRANAILKSASAFFAAELDRPSR
jgi:transposase-like protein